MPGPIQQQPHYQQPSTSVGELEHNKWRRFDRDLRLEHLRGHSGPNFSDVRLDWWLINNGSIRGVGFITGPNLYNQGGGLIEASGGTLDLSGSNVTNLSNGTLRAGAWWAAANSSLKTAARCSRLVSKSNLRSAATLPGSARSAPPHVIFLLNFFDELRRLVPAGGN
jgi:hypothetical protein